MPRGSSDQASTATKSLQQPNSRVRQQQQQEDDDEYEGPDFKRAVFENTKHVVNILCIWDCTRLWIRIR